MHLPHPYFGDGRPRAISHAGVADRNSDPGTLTAYRRAHELGFRWLQVDVVAVDDHQLLSLHAVTGRSRRVEGRDRAELGRLLPDRPTLSELLDALPRARLNVEIKSRRALPALLEHLDRLDRTGDAGRLCVSAPFHRSILTTVRRRYGGRVATCASLLEGALVGLPLVRSRPPGPDAVQIWWPLTLVPGLLARSRGALGRVEVWTVNSPSRVRHLLGRGVDAVVTDDHEAVREAFREVGAWPAGDAGTT